MVTEQSEGYEGEPHSAARSVGGPEGRGEGVLGAEGNFVVGAGGDDHADDAADDGNEDADHEGDGSPHSLLSEEADEEEEDDGDVDADQVFLPQEFLSALNTLTSTSEILWPSSSNRFSCSWVTPPTLFLPSPMLPVLTLICSTARMLTTAQMIPSRQQTTMMMTSRGKLRGDWQSAVWRWVILSLISNMDINQINIDKTSTS